MFRFVFAATEWNISLFTALCSLYGAALWQASYMNNATNGSNIIVFILFCILFWRIYIFTQHTHSQRKIFVCDCLRCVWRLKHIIHWNDAQIYEIFMKTHSLCGKFQVEQCALLFRAIVDCPELTMLYFRKIYIKQSNTIFCDSHSNRPRTLTISSSSNFASFYQFNLEWVIGYVWICPSQFLNRNSFAAPKRLSRLPSEWMALVQKKTNCVQHIVRYSSFFGLCRVRYPVAGNVQKFRANRTEWRHVRYDKLYPHIWLIQFAFTTKSHAANIELMVLYIPFEYVFFVRVVHDEVHVISILSNCALSSKDDRTTIAVV